MAAIAVYGEELDPEVLERKVGTLDDSEFAGNSGLVRADLQRVQVDGMRADSIAPGCGFVPLAVWNFSVPAIRAYEDAIKFFEGMYVMRQIREMDILDAWSNERRVVARPNGSSMPVYVPNPDRSAIITPSGEEIWGVVQGMQMATLMTEQHVADAMPEHIARYLNSVFGRALMMPAMMIEPRGYYSSHNVQLLKPNMDYLGIKPGDEVELQYRGAAAYGVAKRMPPTTAKTFASGIPLDELVLLGLGAVRDLGIDTSPSTMRPVYEDLLVTARNA